MKTTTFKFETRTELLDIPSASLSVRRWISRRAYPIRIVGITSTSVLVELQAPSTTHHNRAVNALGKILQRQLDHRHFVLESRLTPSFES
jgi:hypothetical protein